MSTTPTRIDTSTIPAGTAQTAKPSPVSARGVVVYDREAMLERDEGADRRDYIAETGRPLFLSRYGAQSIVGEGF